MRATRTVLVALAGLIFVVGAVPGSAHATFTCSGTVSGMTISDNVTVDPHGTCILDHVNVTGNVNSAGGDFLYLLNSSVGGSITQTNGGGAGFGADFQLFQTTVSGNVLFQLNGHNGVPPDAVSEIEVFGATINGSLTIDQNNVFGSIGVYQNFILGNLTVSNNTLADGSSTPLADGSSTPYIFIGDGNPADGNTV